jgi:hypothetical protein
MYGGPQHQIWAWVLCSLLFWLTANPPHCDLCDGFFFTVASTQTPVLKRSLRSHQMAVMASARAADSMVCQMPG